MRILTPIRYTNKYCLELDILIMTNQRCSVVWACLILNQVWG